MRIQITDIVDRLYDQDFRRALRQDAKAVLKEHGPEINSNIQIVVKTNTAKDYYLVIPDNKHIDINELQFYGTGADKSLISTIASASTVGTAACICETISSLSSAGTAGTYMPK